MRAPPRETWCRIAGRAILFSLCFATGCLTGCFLCLYWTADQRLFGAQYPSPLIQATSHDSRLIGLLKRNDTATAERLLRIDLRSNLETLMALTNSFKLKPSQMRILEDGLGILNQP